MDVKETILKYIENPEAKKLMEQFFDEVDKLYNDMDNLSYEEFKLRKEAMWDLKCKADDIDGTITIIDLFGLSEKAEKLYNL